MGLNRSNVTIEDQREKTQRKKTNEETEVSGRASWATGMAACGKTCFAEIDAR
jgi:adenylylsulfate kinase-like enzyme